MKCYKCNGKLEQHVELIIHEGKTIPQNVMKCVKCGTTITHIDDYEKTRKQMHPSLVRRIKSYIFGGTAEFVDLSKGKVL
jgi:uncharacterized Zn finger protein